MLCYVMVLYVSLFMQNFVLIYERVLLLGSQNMLILPIMEI